MENIYDVHWQGPYTYEEVLALESEPNLVLYSVYSTHPMYGCNVLVYIGMTTKGASRRLTQHSHWTLHEPNPVQIYAAAIGEFTSWKQWDNTEEYPPLPESTISEIEALLIISHQPAYNSRSKKNAGMVKNIRIFNTGKFGSLLPEVSSLYHLGE